MGRALCYSGKILNLIQCTGIPDIPADMNQLLFVYPMLVLVNGNHCMPGFMQNSICEERGVNVPRVPSPILCVFKRELKRG